MQLVESSSVRHIVEAIYFGEEGVKAYPFDIIMHWIILAAACGFIRDSTITVFFKAQKVALVKPRRHIKVVYKFIQDISFQKRGKISC